MEKTENNNINEKEEVKEEINEENNTTSVVLNVIVFILNYKNYLIYSLRKKKLKKDQIDLVIMTMFQIHIQLNLIKPLIKIDIIKTVKKMKIIIIKIIVDIMVLSMLMILKK